MKENSIELAQNEIDEALKTVNSIEEVLNDDSIPKNKLKEEFLKLTSRVQELECILKNEGII